jgi:hypothetical protein
MSRKQFEHQITHQGLKQSVKASFIGVIEAVVFEDQLVYDGVSMLANTIIHNSGINNPHVLCNSMFIKALKLDVPESSTIESFMSFMTDVTKAELSVYDSIPRSKASYIPRFVENAKIQQLLPHTVAYLTKQLREAVYETNLKDIC